MVENTDAAVAAELGLSPEEYDALSAALREIPRDAQVVLKNGTLVRDRDGKEVWEIEIPGTLSIQSGLNAEFRFRVVIVGQELWRGSSQTPDWYKITGPGGAILFEGEVENPDNQSDDGGWRRYETFASIRLPAFDAVFACLATGRAVIASS